MARRNTAEAEVQTEGPALEPANVPASETITIQGYEFSAPSPYSEGHVLNQNEAATLNQTFQENLRNNFAGRVKSAKEADALGEGNEGYLPFNIDELRTEFAEYASEYKFGVRRAGATTSRDPVMARAMVMARKIIKDAIKAQGLNAKDYADQIDELAENYLKGEGASLVDTARDTLAREQEAAKAAAASITLPRITPTPAAA